MCCAAARRWVVRGVLLGEVGSPGVVVVYGRARSRWCDVQRQALRIACASLLQVLPPAATQGPGGFPMRRTRALRRALNISCTRAACAAWATVSVRMAGCSCSPSASAWIWRIAVLDNAFLVMYDVLDTETDRRLNNDFNAPRMANMLRIPIFSWPTKPKAAGDPTLLDVCWLLILSRDSWTKKEKFRRSVLSLREASRNNFSLFADSELSDVWTYSSTGDG